VTKRDRVSRSPRRSPTRRKKFPILVNNAGIARRNGMLGAAEAVIGDWEDIIAINLTGVFNDLCVRALAPARGASSTSAR
jgi:NAD(P)-dependent dehydrogenase (short-subunit alcohol dehydrogenase family)